MRKFLTSCFILLCSVVYAQTDYFPNLKKILVDKDMNVFVKYDPSCTTLFNKKLSALAKTDPLYSDDEMMGEDIKLLETCLTPNCKERYTVVFSYGPSADPSFLFYKTSNPDEAVFVSWGMQLYLTANGFFYISGHTNNTYDARRKFKIANDTISEVVQPYHYVGLKTRTKQAITLYSDDNMKNIVAQLPPKYPIEVLLADQSEEFKYLIKTDFGLVGWVKFDMIYMDDQIEGLYYSGD